MLSELHFRFAKILLSEPQMSRIAVRKVEKSSPYIPQNAPGNDGFNKNGLATATCFCGAVQLQFVSVE